MGGLISVLIFKKLLLNYKSFIFSKSNRYGRFNLYQTDNLPHTPYPPNFGIHLCSSYKEIYLFWTNMWAITSNYKFLNSIQFGLFWLFFPPPQTLYRVDMVSHSFMTPVHYQISIIFLCSLLFLVKHILFVRA